MVNKRSEKETNRNMSDLKKHRKAISTSASNDVPEIKMPKEDVYANVIRFEEEESLKRPAEKDSALYLETCEKFKKNLTEMIDLKAQGVEQSAQQLTEKKIAGSFLLTVLKKVSRLDKVRVRHGRDELHKEKLSVDSNKLQLQNLLYEANHLRREVKQCLLFKSQDEEIDLVDEEQFFAEAPDTISQPEKTRTDDHNRRLARLEWELHQRKELSVMCRDLQLAKETVAQEIDSTTNRIQALMPSVNKLLEATRPLQDALGLQVEKKWAIDQKAILLPRPLYVAYVNISAYAEFCEELNDVIITGAEDEAKDLDSIDKLIVGGGDKSAADAMHDISDTSIDKDFKDNDDDDEDGEHDGQRSMKKHHHRRQNSTVAAEVNVYKPHPLSVSFRVDSGIENCPSLQVTICYLPSLHLVTVQIKLNGLTGDSVALCESLDPRTVLNCLTKSDNDDDDILHPKIKCALRNASIDQAQFIAALSEQQLGKPYIWVQNLCGLSYQASEQAGYEQIQAVSKIIDRMRSRLKSRYCLHRQLTALKNKTYNNLLTANSSDTQTKITCVLAQWSPITYAEVAGRTTIIQRFVDEGLITKKHLFYHAIIICDGAKMDCFVNVSPDFPNECPIWSISLNLRGDLNASNSADMRDIESWINSIHMNKQNVSTVIVLQLKRAMSALDVFVDTERMRRSNLTTDPKVDKSFLKIFRSRTRTRPYRSVNNNGSIIYTQP